MHPRLSERLVRLQLEEALGREGLFNDRVQLESPGYPRFFVRFTNSNGVERLIRFDCTNYDFDAIEIEPVDPITHAPLPADDWMLRGGGGFPPHHMKNGGPFLCLDGTRDYYTHEGHRPTVTGQRWEQLRGELRITDLIRVISNKFTEGAWT